MAEDDLTAVVAGIIASSAAAGHTGAQTAARIVSRLRRTGRLTNTPRVRDAYTRITEAIRAIREVPGNADKVGLGVAFLELWEDAFDLVGLQALRAEINRRITEGEW